MENAFHLWKPKRVDLKTKKLVLLHGMGGTGMLWRPIAASLEDEMMILAPDQRGHGRSRVHFAPGGREEPGYTPLDYGRDLVETLDRHDFLPAWIVGHSMGVRSACAVAHLRPEGVEGLILVDLGFAGAAGGGLGDGLAQFLRILPMEFASRADARQFMADHCPDPSIGQYLMAVSTPASGGGLTFPFDKTALIQTIEAARDSSVRGWIEEFARATGKPVLVLRGAESQVWSAEDFAAERARFRDLPNVVFEEMPGTGHGLPFEKRLEFVARLRRFLNERV